GQRRFVTLTFVYSFSDPRVREFLQAGTRTGKLSYTAADGRPLVNRRALVHRSPRPTLMTMANAPHAGAG
ncbi:MAG: hypothetical protein KGL35_11555, partial [Bradyrhizobium sp.]|nr:hypothetical protein [Bradyrhizobium sp.]